MGVTPVITVIGLPAVVLQSSSGRLTRFAVHRVTSKAVRQYTLTSVDGNREIENASAVPQKRNAPAEAKASLWNSFETRIAENRAVAWPYYPVSFTKIGYTLQVQRSSQWR
jgi:hypothetical protein